MVKAATARYASVLPPPVGNQIKSTILFLESEFKSVILSMLSNKNAN